MKNIDICFGIAGSVTTWGLTAVNGILALIAGILTVAVMVLRLRREWKIRNRDPDDED